MRADAIAEFLSRVFKDSFTWRQRLGELIVLFCACLLPLNATAQVKATRRVLIFYEIGLSSPSVSILDQGIRSVLENSPFQIELYREYLETTLFPDATAQQDIREWYLRKYRDRKPDLIIVLGVSPLRFIADVHERAFKDVPVVFGGTSAEKESLPKLGPQFTGVWDTLEPERTLEVALQLHPGTRHVVVVGGQDAFDLELEGWFRERLRRYESSLDFRYMTDLPMPKLLDALSHLPPNTVVLQTHIGLDAAGTRFVGASQADPMVVKASNSPVFGPSDVDLGHGEVGGYLDSFASQGHDIGEMATRILNGESPKNIPVVTGTNAYMFDWRALRRWGFDEKDLPPGSIVLNREPSLWESYKWYIVGATFLFLAQTSLIAGLMTQRATRRKAEAELALIYERLRLSLETGKAVGWDWDVKTGQDRWFGDLQTVFGIPSDTYCGRVEDFRRRVHPEDKELVWKAVADARENHKPYATEFRVIRDDGTVRWITARGKFYYAINGDAERMLGMSVDITDRKLAEQQVRESEERFRLVANTAPVLIWMSGTDKLCTYFNKPWLEFTGRSLQQELGNGWANGVHPDDLKRFLNTYTQSFDQRKNFRMEYRLRRYDGEYRWMLDFGVPRFDGGGIFVGYIGSAVDVTERKRMEQAVQESEERLRLAAQAGKMFAYSWDRATDVIERSGEAAEILGVDPTQGATGTSVAAMVHPEDKERLEIALSKLNIDEPYLQVTYRIIRPDGAVVWLQRNSRAYFKENGELERIVGMIVDVTVRKLAEEALSTVSRRLIQAQEQERTHIARELHDDINQRLAMLQLDLNQLGQDLPESLVDLRERIEELRNRTTDTSNEVQAISHRLHSSKLEYLGLVTACKSFCKEVAERQKIRIEFKADDISFFVPQDVSLALFRVLQESLQNAIKHSRAENVEVNLLWSPSEVQFSVRDDGCGFDVNAALSSHGLGLISMRERVSLIGGTLLITSDPLHGTEIKVRVPVVVGTDTSNATPNAA